MGGDLLCKVALLVVYSTTVVVVVVAIEAASADKVARLEGVVLSNEAVAPVPAAEVDLTPGITLDRAVAMDVRERNVLLEHEDTAANTRNSAVVITVTPPPILEDPASAVLPPGVGNMQPNGCAQVNPLDFANGNRCGAPLSSPCFNYRRCQPLPESKGPSIYVYDAECSLADSDDLPTTHGDGGGDDDDDRHHSSYWREAAREVGSLSNTYDRACLFIEVNAFGHYEPCAPSAPLWNGGANHVMVEFTDDVSSNDIPRTVNSYAMQVGSNTHTCVYRSGYDISVPLPPKALFSSFAYTSPVDRQYFLTVKGAVYLSGHGSEDRMSVVPLHDEANDVIVAMHCFEMHREHLEPNNAEFCQALKARYNDYDYESLMNTTFALVPSGRELGTFRLGEVMSAGAIPVFIARDIIRPFREQFDWPSFSFMFSPERVGPEMVETLRAVPPDVLNEMQRKSLEAYREMFGMDTTFKAIARKTIHLLKQRIEYHR